MISAKSWMRALTSSRNANSTLVRCDSEDCDQVWKAAAAVCTAVSTSATLASATSACCSPVAGFHTGLVRVELPDRGLAADPVRDGPQRDPSVFGASSGRCSALCAS